MLTGCAKQTTIVRQQQNQQTPLRRSWNRTLNCEITTINQGEYHICSGPEAIATLLGSCIAVCIRDVHLNIGGMNHFLLPYQNNTSKSTDKLNEGRYGYWSMELLLNGLYKRGANKNNLEVKVFGGGNVLSMTNLDIGRQNIDFIHEYLDKEGLNITSESTGGNYSRKVIYFPETGKAKLKLADRDSRTGVAKRDMEYITELKHKPLSGEIELF